MQRHLLLKLHRAVALRKVSPSSDVKFPLAAIAAWISPFQIGLSAQWTLHEKEARPVQLNSFKSYRRLIAKMPCQSRFKEVVPSDN